MSNLRRIRRKLLSKPIVLIGAGQLGEMSLNLWPNNLQKPVLILDNKRDGTLNGIEIKKLDSHNFSNRYVYVLAMFKVDPKSVNNWFKEIRQEIVIVYDVFECFSPEDFTNGWTGNLLDALNILLLKKHFESKNARGILNEIMRWKCFRLLDNSIFLSPENMKYHQRQFHGRQIEFDYVVDVGAHDLYLLKNSEGLEIKFKNYVAIEPDYTVLKTYNKILQPALSQHKVSIIEAALAGFEGPAYIQWGGLLAARLILKPKKGNEALVRVTTLKRIFEREEIEKEHKILIKLHIEGCEYDVIRSSVELLKNYNSIFLMINLSHNKQSLFYIPRILGNLGYSLQLESHALFGEGLTLYAYKRKSRV